MRKNPRRQFTCALLLTGVSTIRRGIPKWGIRGCSMAQDSMSKFRFQVT
jgi:hypothetical protein